MRINGIDFIDNQIVDLLLKNGRISYSEIGEKVGLSRTAVKTRIAALERAGIIKGYKAIIDPESAPEMMTFVLNIETKPEHFEECKQVFVESSETVTIVQTTGRCHLVAICVAPDTRAMRIIAAEKTTARVFFFGFIFRKLILLIFSTSPGLFFTL